MFAVNSVPYNYTQEDSWAFISDGVCNADNTIKLGEASLVLLTSDVERQTGEIQQDLSCSLSLLVPEAHNDGIAVSAAGSMSCANAISIEGRCTKSNCEVSLISMNVWRVERVICHNLPQILQ